MADLLVSDQKKIEILKALADEKIHTYYNLSKLVDTNYDTIKKNCRFLELLGLIHVNRISSEESASGKAHYAVKITQLGKEKLKNIRNRSQGHREGERGGSPSSYI